MYKCNECGEELTKGQFFFKLTLYEMQENDIADDQTDRLTKPIFVHTGCFLSQEGE